MIRRKFQDSSVSKILSRHGESRPTSTLTTLVQTNSNKSNYSQVTEEQRNTDNLMDSKIEVDVMIENDHKYQI